MCSHNVLLWLVHLLLQFFLLNEKSEDVTSTIFVGGTSIFLFKRYLGSRHLLVWNRQENMVVFIGGDVTTSNLFTLWKYEINEWCWPISMLWSSPVFFQQPVSRLVEVKKSYWKSRPPLRRLMVDVSCQHTYPPLFGYSEHTAAPGPGWRRALH